MHVRDDRSHLARATRPQPDRIRLHANVSGRAWWQDRRLDRRLFDRRVFWVRCIGRRSDRRGRERIVLAVVELTEQTRGMDRCVATSFCGGKRVVEQDLDQHRRDCIADRDDLASTRRVQMLAGAEQLDQVLTLEHEARYAAGLTMT
jgi:hypothetical protein